MHQNTTTLLGVGAIVTAIAGGTCSTNARIDDVNVRIDDVNARIDAVNVRIDALDTGLRAELRRLDERMRTVEIGFAKIDQRLLTLERVILPAAEEG